MKPSRNYFYHWKKLQRRYRSVQSRWVTNRSNKLKRKLDILGRRLHSLNRKWKLGIAASALGCWLAAMPIHVIQAQDSSFAPVISPSGLDGSNGFTINGVNSSVGQRVSNLGDINGDGIEDIFIGTRSATGYVVFVKNEGFPSSFELSSVDGSNGFILEGTSSRNYLEVSGAGDVNGDGFYDLIVGNLVASPNGKTYAGSSHVIFGHPGEFPSLLRLSSNNFDGNNGFIINGESQRDVLGISVGAAGDINGDGIDDLVIGASGVGTNGDGSGAGYVIFGTTDGFASSFDLTTLDGTNGAVFNGENADDRAGRAVSGAGDINNDGFDDLIIGASGADNGDDISSANIGKSYVVFGSDRPFAHPFELSSLDGTNGFTVNGSGNGNGTGYSVSDAGDVDGDGIDDIMIGSRSERVYVVFGSESPFPSALAVSALDGFNGFVLSARGIVGDRGSIRGAGDINGDGVNDLIIGARLASPNENYRSGSSYVVLGNRNGFDASIDLSSLDGTNGFIFQGAETRQLTGFAVSSAGDLNHDGWDDVIIGSPGTDVNGINSGAGHVIFGKGIPVVANAILDQSSVVGEAFAFQVPINTFFHKNEDEIMALSATLVGGQDLPSWLSFDPNSNTFRGTPMPSDLTSLMIKVTATATDGLTVSDEFELKVLAAAPVLAGVGTRMVDIGLELRFTASATDTDSDTLTFSLDDTSLGKGMTIDPSTGEFRWTPDEALRGEHQVVFSVSDGSLSDSETVTFIVNGPPELAEIAPQTGDAGALLSFTATATDADDNNTLTFSLDDTSLGKGMTIDPSTGEFRWTPDETLRGEHQVVFSVSDGSLSDSETVTFIVNGPPELAEIAPQTGDAGALLSFTATATDADDNNTLTFSLDNTSLGKGMTIDPSTGEFRWTPDETLRGEHQVVFSVSDGSLSDSETVTFIVNGPPELVEIAPQTGDAGAVLSFTATAMDADANNTLTFSIDTEALDKGMTIDPTTGEFRWTPTPAQSGTHEVTVTVSDGSLTGSQTVTLTVRVITSIPDELAPSIKLHPNPVEDRLQLVVNNVYLGELALHLTDLNGRSLLKQELSKSNERMEVDLDMSTLRAGVYFIEIRSREGNLWEKQRILKR